MKKISVITVVKNGMPYLKDCINSFNAQVYENKEQIIIASPSTDSTEEFLKSIELNQRKIFFDENLLGRYDAINFGISKASGEIIGLLHADDIFYNNNTLKIISQNFGDNDCIYGNIIFSKRNDTKKIKRKWISSKFDRKKLYFGWTPPHTSLFLKKKLVKDNLYDLKYEISSDYDFILRLFLNEKLKVKYLPFIFSIMRLGGDSTDLKKLKQKIEEDLNILKKYFIFYFFVWLMKLIRKINQFF